MTTNLEQILSKTSEKIQRTNPRYGRVFFAARLKHDLTTEEVLLADVIQTLSRKTGWSFASKDYLAHLLGVSPRTVQRHVRALEIKGLVRRHPKHLRQLQTTPLWITSR